MPFPGLWGRFDRILFVRKQRFSMSKCVCELLTYVRILTLLPYYFENNYMIDTTVISLRFHWFPKSAADLLPYRVALARIAFLLRYNTRFARQSAYHFFAHSSYIILLHFGINYQNENKT
jgi:hypothetical protein